MEKPSNHAIILENIKNNQTFHYSLVICKGHIDTTTQNLCKSTTCIFVQTLEASYQTPIKPQELKAFKVLLDLKPGSNLITISYCCTSLTLTLHYQGRASPLTVLPIYIISSGHDGTFQAPKNEINTPESAQKRITLACRLMQSLISEKLYEAGFERKTFRIDPLECILFKSTLNPEEVYSMNKTELWYHFAREIMRSPIGDIDKKYLAFLSCTRYDGSGYSDEMTHDDIVSLTKGYVAFGGEGLALLGTACLYTWPENFAQILENFANELPVDKAALMDDSCFRGTRGACFATTLGAALHELCHTFDLGHSRDGIMGRGFDNTQNIFLNTSIRVQNKELNIFTRRKLSDDIFFTKNCSTILNYHRWFNTLKGNKEGAITYDKQAKVIKSTSGLGVVEIREKPNDLVVKFWVFLHKVLKYSHRIDEEFREAEDLILFIEDVKGNVFKGNL